MPCRLASVALGLVGAEAALAVEVEVSKTHGAEGEPHQQRPPEEEGEHGVEEERGKDVERLHLQACASGPLSSVAQASAIVVGHCFKQASTGDAPGKRLFRAAAIICAPTSSVDEAARRVSAAGSAPRRAVPTPRSTFTCCSRSSAREEVSTAGATCSAAAAQTKA